MCEYASVATDDVNKQLKQRSWLAIKDQQEQTSCLQMSSALDIELHRKIVLF